MPDERFNEHVNANVGARSQKDLFEPLGNRIDSIDLHGDEEIGEEDPKVVDEIESLCMNCQENVGYSGHLSISIYVN